MILQNQRRGEHPNHLKGWDCVPWVKRISHQVSFLSLICYLFLSAKFLHWVRLSPCGRKYDHTQFPSFTSQFHHRVGLSHTNYFSLPKKQINNPSRTSWFGCPTVEYSTLSRKQSCSENCMIVVERRAIFRRVAFPEVRRWLVKQTVSILHKIVLCQWLLETEISNSEVFLYNKIIVFYLMIKIFIC